MPSKKAFITGIAGQDGSYLTEFLLGKNYEVHGLMMPSSDIKNISGIKDKIFLHEGDVTVADKTSRILQEVSPEEIYHLAATATASFSPETERKIFEDNLYGIYNVLESARKHVPRAKIFMAGSSLMFGSPKNSPQNEETPMEPNTPYGIAKTAGYFISKIHRELYGSFICTGILFNHESPRRNMDFVTKKITSAVARIKNGSREPLKIGDLNVRKDWGYARDYVEAMWLMLQDDKPEDYVLATGESYSVKEFVEVAFKLVGIDIRWEGNGLQEKGVQNKTGKVLVQIDPKFTRKGEAVISVGNPSKAEKRLGWKRKIGFRELVAMMLDNDLKTETIK